MRQVFGLACLYGQVIKTRRNDRIVKVERRILPGGVWKAVALRHRLLDAGAPEASFRILERA